MNLYVAYAEVKEGENTFSFMVLSKSMLTHTHGRVADMFSHGSVALPQVRRKLDLQFSGSSSSVAQLGER